ncbi:hypothetical protein MNBD_GAMMA07-566 [hydrothermal vent metagenome]|uniref:Uncharacterized protein n=1 Tax=hydrothermal vent metagenome TaxID=652676 RepID=A0A3B0WU18_9ZZZZ
MFATTVNYFRLFSFILLFLLNSGMSLSVYADGNTQASNQQDKKTVKTPKQQLDYLINLAKQLTKEARSGNAAASSFRINVVFYRETLREFMLKQPSNSIYSKKLLMEFVRMLALLKSAAECQTGRYIVCPAQLMIQLKAQKTRLVEMYAQVASG